MPNNVKDIGAGGKMETRIGCMKFQGEEGENFDKYKEKVKT